MSARKLPVDLELESRVARARTAGNVAEHRLRDDDRAVARVYELQAKLRSALNAVPQVREDVFAACDALEGFTS